MELKLDGLWRLRQEPLSKGVAGAPEVLASLDGWIETKVPCDVRMPLIERGLIRDPVVADYCFESEWVEDRSWWFRKEFSWEASSAGGRTVELFCGMLDAESDVFLNGRHLGHHRSAFHPFVAEVGPDLRVGMNTLLVRVTSGLEHYTLEDVAGFADTVFGEADAGRSARGDKRRAMVRKPQYVFGWDWGPRVATCGIMMPVSLRMLEASSVRSVHAVTMSIGSSANSSAAVVLFEAEIENFRPLSSHRTHVEIAFTSPSGRRYRSERRDVFLQSGLNYVAFTVEVADPEVWWPNGMGAQPMYDAVCTIEGQEGFPFRFALRTVALDMEPLNAVETGFAVQVNGRKVFCKGANWIPADSIYARVTNDKYRRLVEEAVASNFNMLRVWGGGLYEQDVFYDLCDELGIMVWQDFMFACAGYPDDREWFVGEVEAEMDYQTRRLRNHPCVVLWCGNNEISQVMVSMDAHRDQPTYPGARLFHRLAPSIVRKNCPETPYWPSSPYGGADPMGDDSGDKHHWGECMMNPDMRKRIAPEEYDGLRAKFVSEYGYPGPCRIESIREYLGGATPDRDSALWALHNNAFEKDTVQAGIAFHYREAGSLSLEDYLLHASMCQGLMLGYSLEALRFNPGCFGGLYWMYDDCWGETGWTTLDYYVRRKPSFYFVRRAFSPRKLILREVDGRTVVVGINETPEPLTFTLEYGYVGFDGTGRKTERTAVRLPAQSRQVVHAFDRHAFERSAMGGTGSNDTTGVHFAMPVEPVEGLVPAILRLHPHRDLVMPLAAPEVFDVLQEQDGLHFKITSRTFAHGVHFRCGAETKPMDAYFDLLPGEVRSITLAGHVAGIPAADKTLPAAKGFVACINAALPTDPGTA
jgi:beta-mannosidase